MSIGHAPESSDSVLASFLTPTVHLLVWFTVVTKLVVLALELLRVQQQSVSTFRWCFAYYHAHRHTVVKFLILDFHCSSPCPAAAQLATARVLDPLFLVRFRPPTVSKLRTRSSRCTSHKACPKVNVANKAYRVWLAASVSVGVFAVVCDCASRRSATYFSPPRQNTFPFALSCLVFFWSLSRLSFPESLNFF